MSRVIDGAVLTEWISGECKSPSCPKNESAFGMRILEHIEGMQTIEPERKKGMWIPVTNGRGGFECDQCHNYAPSYQDGVEWLSGFCPNCGAEMTEESEEPKRCDTCKHEKEPWTSGCSDCFDYELWEEKDETGRFTTED